MSYKPFFIIAIFCISAISNAAQAQRTDIVSAEVVGAGVTEADAINNALLNAIRSVIGESITASRKLTDDQIIEEISSTSSGWIRSYEVIRSQKRDDLKEYQVKVKAAVSISDITEKIEAYIEKYKLDTGNTSGEYDRQKQIQSKESLEFESKYEKLVEFIMQLPESLYDVKITKMNLVKTNETTNLLIKFSVEFKKKFQNEICNAAKSLESKFPEKARTSIGNEQNSRSKNIAGLDCDGSLLKLRYTKLKRNDYELLLKKLKNSGVCLKLEDVEGSTVSVFKSGDQILYSDWQRAYDNSLQPIQIGNENVSYNNNLRYDFRNFGETPIIIISAPYSFEKPKVYDILVDQKVLERYREKGSIKIEITEANKCL
jgi:hypothetical protein